VNVVALPPNTSSVNVVHEDGGPRVHNGWQDEQRPFDSTCRKFYRFPIQPPRRIGSGILR
jgi:hypothetical protein